MTLAKWIGLCLILCCSSVLARQAEIYTSGQVARVQQSNQLKERYDALLPLFFDGELDSLRHNLNGLSALEREYLLYLFSQQALNMDRFSDKTRNWLTELSQARPYALIEKESADYIVTEPAFDYPALARAALRGWRVAHQHLDFHRQLSQGKLDVRLIFDKDNPFIEEQQESLAQVLPMQNPKRLIWLEQQLDRYHAWYPDNLIIAQIAMLNGSEAFYRKLWQRPVDGHSVKAAWWVKHNYSSEQAFELLKIAAANPEMTEHAWQLMSELVPMTAETESYLVSALSSEDLGEVAAQVLAQLNNRNVLARLVKLVTDGDPAETATQNAWLSLFLNNSNEARRLIKQLFELESIRKHYGPVKQK